ncbi:serine hydrolase [Thaumasiovibrio subtropicus]|uniref:serine hydrolase n=1 Tax=Thaumasiovibrio subtropicus TaxID=1891207 RepID=UPI000B34BB22|nr:serine hydrolase [Thaumasiovibrio subtropicus]
MYKLALRSLPALCFMSLSATAAPAIVPDAPSIAAKGYVLMDFKSGQILAENHQDTRLHPASLTKLMTSYVIGQEIKQGNLSHDDDVTISEKAWAKNFPGSSKMFIEVGTSVKVSDLNRGIIIQSGNDACVAMAEHIAGSTDAFAELMNGWATTLNMTQSSFSNPHGLDDDKLYTTPYDMALLTQAIIRDLPEEFPIYGEKSFTYNGITQYNRNGLLWDESLNVDGMKTGHTNKAGYSLVSTATQNDMRLIAVVMGTESPDARKAESKKLLSYGFRFFGNITPNQAGDVFATERVWMGETDTVKLGLQQDIHLTLPRSQIQSLEASFTLNETLKAPIKTGDVLGTIYYHADGEDIAEYPLVALEDIKEGSWFSQMQDKLSLSVSGWFG